jgi:hypothetical protein
MLTRLVRGLWTHLGQDGQAKQGRDTLRWRALPLLAVAAVVLIAGTLATRPWGQLGAQPACTINWINTSGGAWNTVANWSPARVPLASDVVCITATGAYTVTISGLSVAVTAASIGGAGSTPTVSIEGRGCADLPASLTTTGALTNSGTIAVTATEGCGGEPASVSAGGAFTNTGSISVTGGSGGPRTVSGALTSSGAVTIGAHTTFTGQFVNNGTLTFGGGDPKLTFSGAGNSFQQGATGTINASASGNAGVVATGGATLSVDGGSFTGTAGQGMLAVDAANLVFGSGAAVTGTNPRVLVRRASTLAGNVPAGMVIDVTAAGCAVPADKDAALSAGAGLTNAGAITLSADGGCGGGAATLAVTSGTLTNTGSITVTSGANGARALNGVFASQGTATINATTTLTGTLTNTGLVAFGGGDPRLLVDGAASVYRSSAGSTLDTSASAGSGVVAINNALLAIDGGTLTGNGANRVAVVDGSRLQFGVGATVSGSGRRVQVRRASTLTGDVPAGMNIDVTAAGCQSPAPAGDVTLTATASLTSAGAITLSSDSGCGGAAATLGSGSGTITSTGSITVNGGASGGRTLTGTFVSSGSLSINWDTVLTGSFTSNGQVALAGGGIDLILDGAGNNMRITGGSVTSGDGTIAARNGAELRVDGGAFTPNNANPIGEVSAAALRFGGSAAVSGAAIIAVHGESTLTGDVPANTTVAVRGLGCTGLPARLTATGDFASAGTITLDATQGCGGANATLRISGGRLTSSGSLQTISGANGGRLLDGSITNTGAVTIGTHTGATGQFVNNGTLTFSMGDPRLTLTGAGNGFRNGTMGTVNASASGNAGVVATGDATLTVDGGTFTGAAGNGMLTVDAANLVFGAGATVGGTNPRVLVRHASTLSGNVPAAMVVDIIGHGCESPASAGNVVLTAGASLTNAGAIMLSSDAGCGGAAATLAVTSGTLTNTGSITVTSGASGGRAITGVYANSGTVNVNATTTLTGTLTNTGLVKFGGGDPQLLVDGMTSLYRNSVGGTLDTSLSGGSAVVARNGATLALDGGTLTGFGGNRVAVVDGGTLQFGAGATFSGTNRRVLVRRASTLAGNVPAGVMVDVTAAGCAVPADKDAALTAGAGLTNAGTITLSADGGCGGGTATLGVNGGLVTNNGTVQAAGGAGGARSILVSAGEFRQGTGTISGLAAGLTVTTTGAGVFSGAGTIDASVVNGGVVAPGASAGTMTLNGSYTQQAGGTLRVELASGGFDVLAVAGAANLAGALDVQLLGGFTPMNGAEFAIVTAASVDGEFGSVTNGHHVTYEDESATLVAGAAPPPPTPPVPANTRLGTVTSSSLEFMWNDGPDETAYQVAYFLYGSTAYIFVDRPAGSTSYTRTGLMPGTTVYFWARACNGSQCSGWSGAVTGITSGVTTPAVPTNLAVGMTTSSSIQITWTDNATDETAYQVAYMQYGGSAYSFTTLAANSASHIQGSLPPATGMYFFVRACNGAQCTAWVGPVSGATTGLTPPAAPTSLALGTVTNSSIAISWTDAATNETAYEVAYQATGAGSASYASLAANTTTYSRSGLAAGSTVYFWVRACNGSTCSSWVGPLTGTTTGGTAPPAPTGLMVGTVTNTSIQVTWTDNATTETHYRVAYRRYIQPDITWVDLAANTASFTLSSLGPGQTYHFYVQACNGALCTYSTPGVVLGTTPGGVAPAKPAGASIGTTTATSIQVNWTDTATTESRYEVSWVQFGSSTYIKQDLPVGATTYTIPGLTSPQSYYVWVRACYDVQCSDYFGLDAWTDGTPLPAAPTNHMVTGVTNSTITTTWTDVATDETRYQVSYSTTGGHPPFTFIDRPANSAGVTITGLAAGTTAEMWVRVCHGLRCTPWVAHLTGTTTGGAQLVAGRAGTPASTRTAATPAGTPPTRIAVAPPPDPDETPALPAALSGRSSTGAAIAAPPTPPSTVRISGSGRAAAPAPPANAPLPEPARGDRRGGAAPPPPPPPPANAPLPYRGR